MHLLYWVAVKKAVFSSAALFQEKLSALFVGRLALSKCPCGLEKKGKSGQFASRVDGLSLH